MLRTGLALDRGYELTVLPRGDRCARHRIATRSCIYSDCTSSAPLCHPQTHLRHHHGCRVVRRVPQRPRECALLLTCPLRSQASGALGPAVQRFLFACDTLLQLHGLFRHWRVRFLTQYGACRRYLWGYFRLSYSFWLHPPLIGITSIPIRRSRSSRGSKASRSTSRLSGILPSQMPIAADAGHRFTLRSCTSAALGINATAGSLTRTELGCLARSRLPTRYACDRRRSRGRRKRSLFPAAPGSHYLS